MTASGASQSASPPPRTAKSIFLALALGGLGGAAAFAAGLPLPWMIGAIMATTAAAVMGLPIAVPNRLRSVMVAILGVMLGSAFEPAMLERFADWAVSLACLILYTILAGAACFLYFRRVMHYDPITAYFSAMPGGLSEMILAGAEQGGDERVISLTHASRILLVILILPFALQIAGIYDPALRGQGQAELGALSVPDLGLLTLCGIFGFLIGRAVRLPAAAMVGPMILSAAVHLAGVTAARPPAELINVAQVIVGSAIGCRFVGVRFGFVRRTMGAALGSTLVLLSIAAILAAAMQELTGLDFEACLLAFSPGGVAEMSLVALALGVDAAFVSSHHIVRIFFVVVVAPSSFRLAKSRF